MPKQLKGGPASRILSETEFSEMFNPDNNNGELYAFQEIQHMNGRYVWTIMETGDEDDQNWYAAPGFHAVNVVGFVTSETPWTDDIAEAVYFDADDEVPPYDPEDEYEDEDE